MTLTFAEIVMLKRAEEQTAAELRPKSGMTRCPVCGSRTVVDGDPLRRCGNCVRRRRLPGEHGSRRPRV